uniref:Retrovirus-related Pol polyprotein from transposon TNT 1-94 n=1 Tax=Cajanus cajan TaxID=3821 RepID=A0A151SJX6_CAJCA|nr:hypothetical protein KK1_001267 [Cajanus cajan]
MTWQQQVTVVIRAHDLERFVVNPKIPMKFLTGEDHDANNVNPIYTTWDRKDSLLFSWLLTTLPDSIQARVVSCHHSYQVWDMVFQHFHSLTKIKVTQLRLELRTIKKGTRTCSEYLLRISTIVEILASIGSPVSPREHAECIIGGLPPEYDSLISTITAFVSRDDVLSPCEIETMILAQEARLEQAKTSVIQEPLTINLAQTTSVANGVPNANLAFQQSQMPNSQSNMFQNSAFESQGGYNASFSGQNRDGGRGRGGSRGGQNRGSSVQCQICHKRGHEASTCYQQSFGGFGLPFGPNFSPYTSLGFGSQTSYGPQNFGLGLGPQTGYGSQNFGFLPNTGILPFHGSTNVFGHPGSPQWPTHALSGSFGSTLPNFGFTPPGFALPAAPSATQQAHPSSASSSQRTVPILNTATTWIPNSGASHHATPDP